jgi:hypothetical protein
VKCTRLTAAGQCPNDATIVVLTVILGSVVPCVLCAPCLQPWRDEHSPARYHSHTPLDATSLRYLQR